jgi:hypothetical protein
MAVGPIKTYIFLLMMDFFDWSTNLKKNPLWHILKNAWLKCKGSEQTFSTPKIDIM